MIDLDMLMEILEFDDLSGFEVEDGYIINNDGISLKPDISEILIVAEHKILRKLELKLPCDFSMVEQWIKRNGFDHALPKMRALQEQFSDTQPLVMVKNDVLPEWQDLFTNPPSRHSETFELIKQAVISYIAREGELPKRDQLWEELKLRYTYDDKKKAIVGISGTLMDRDNFRKYFARQTKTT